MDLKRLIPHRDEGEAPVSGGLKAAMIGIAVFAFGLFVWGVVTDTQLAIEAAFPISGLVFALLWINQKNHRDQQQPSDPS